MARGRPPSHRSEEVEFPEGNDDVISKGPCDKCGSSDGNATYADGHTYCYVCKTRTPPTGLASDTGGSGVGGGGERTTGAVPAVHRGDGRGGAGLLNPADFPRQTDGLPDRKLSAAILRRFGYFRARWSGKPVQVAPYYDQDGALAGQKLRLPDKDFVWLKAHDKAPSTNNCRPFGWQVYGDRYDRKVVITEGEIDAMSVAQAIEGTQGIAVVSLGGGAAAALKNVKANYLWLDRFEEIILWLDNDEPGQEAVNELAPLFKTGKVRVIKLPGVKDANELLKDNKPGDIKNAIYMATTWRQPGIVNAADTPADVLAPKQDAETGWSYQWPWPELNETLGPIRPGQVIYHVAGTGVGKTTGIAEVEYDLLRQDRNLRVGHMGFEDSRRDVKLRLLSIHVSKRLDIEALPDDQMLLIHEEVFGGRQVEMFDPETAEWTVDAILGYVRYAAKALDCRVIFLDPLTFIAAGLSLGDDERRALDKASRDLAAMAKELGVHLQVTHHLKRPDGTAHEEGGQTSLNEVRGSGGIANFATIVIGHERNQQAEGEQAMVTQLRALKNRPRSKTGPMVCLHYDMTTGRLTKTDIQFPGPGAKGGRRLGSRVEFPGPSADY